VSGEHDGFAVEAAQPARQLRCDVAERWFGIYGQFSIVLPRHRACVTITAHYPGPTTDILDAIWSDIVPALT